MKRETWCCLILLLVTGCAALGASGAPGVAPTAVQQPVTATPDVAYVGQVESTPESRAIPTASAEERMQASETRLYLHAFDDGEVSVVDPASGRRLHAIPVRGQFPGVAVAPDGARLYLLDGPSAGRLRVLDTRTWQAVHGEPVEDRALPLFGNPLTLPGEGRWLFVDHYSYEREEAWISLFDTERLRFLTAEEAPAARRLAACPRPVRVVGQPGHTRLYAACGQTLLALDAERLTVLWEAPVSSSQSPELALSADRTRLYSMSPLVQIDYGRDGFGRVASTDLQLLVWDSATGTELDRLQLSEEIVVPKATIGRGDRVYLAVAPDGRRLFVAWEDRLWALSAGTHQPMGEIELPAPVDGLATSADGEELYLLPATAGDLIVRGRGLWTVDVQSLRLVRRAEDWPENLLVPVFQAAPAPALGE